MLVSAIDAHLANGESKLEQIVLIDLPAAHPASRVDLLLKVTTSCAAGELAPGYGDTACALNMRWKGAGEAFEEAIDEAAAAAAEAEAAAASTPPPPAASESASKPRPPSLCCCCSIRCCAMLGALIALLLAMAVAGLQANGLTDGTLPFMHLTEPYGLQPSDVPDLHGTRVVLTGASSGLGLGVAKLLAARRATLIITARDPVSCAYTLLNLREHAGPAADITCVEMELLKLTSVETAAAQILTKLSTSTTDTTIDDGTIDWIIFNA